MILVENPTLQIDELEQYCQLMEKGGIFGGKKTEM